jgi:hypothetical protein
VRAPWVRHRIFCARFAALRPVELKTISHGSSCARISTPPSQKRARRGPRACDARNCSGGSLYGTTSLHRPTLLSCQRLSLSRLVSARNIESVKPLKTLSRSSRSSRSQQFDGACAQPRLFAIARISATKAIRILSLSFASQ